MRDSGTMFCPRCGLGFAPGTPSCPACHVGLVGSDARDAGARDGRAVLHDDPATLEHLRTAPASWIRELQQALDDAAIPCRTVISSSANPDLTISVRPRDLERARAIDQVVFARQVPGTDGLRSAEELDFQTCPGCGSSLAETDRECAECGLSLVQPEIWACGACGQELQPPVGRCPSCFTAVTWDDQRPGRDDVSD